MNYLERLRKEICEVTFTKANGEERVMICTLLPDFLPTEEPTGIPITDAQAWALIQTKDIFTVWDIEENTWRSFKPSKVTKFESAPE